MKGPAVLFCAYFSNGKLISFFFQKSFHDKTPYTIMFGPDKCGLDHKVKC